MITLGTVRPGSTLYVPFETFASSTGAPITLTGLAVGDVLIYKDGGTTSRASTNGITLLDTDGIDFNSKTGIHGVSIDLADNSTADFYQAGSRYFVVIGDVTVDSQTMRFLAATFRIGYDTAIQDTFIATLASQTSFTLNAGSADDSAYVGCVAVIHDAASAVQMEMGVISAYTGSTKTVTLAADPGVFTVAAKDNISILPRMNTWALGGLAIPSGAIPNAVAGATGGLFVAGTNAATTITTSGGAALTLSSTGGNGSGLTVSGNGSGHGITAVGGATGHGLYGVGGATTGHGIYGLAQGAGYSGLLGAGNGSGAGIYGQGGATGPGMLVKGGATSGAGLRAENQGGTGGSNYAISAVGGSGADSGGMYLAGGSTGGEGLECVGSGNGHGIYAVGSNTGEGLHAAGGATGDGINAVGGGTNNSGMVLTRGGVGGDDLKFFNSDCTVPLLGNNAITAAVIATGAIDADAFAANAIVAATFATDAIDNRVIAADAIGSSELAATAAAEIADAVWDELATGHTDAGKAGQQLWTDVDAILDDTGTAGVVVASIANNAITANAIATGAIDADSIASSAITSAKFAPGAIDAAAIATGAIDADAIASSAITSAKFAAGAIDATAIATGAIDADALAADAVDEILDEQIGDSTITMRQALKLLVATLGGKLSGAATTTITIRNYADSTDVVSATVDANGNRTATTLTL